MVTSKKALVPGIGLLIFCLAPVSGYAAMYKWVDEEGNTHYTQQPPPEGVEGTTVKPPPKVDTEQAVKELQQTREKLQKIEEEHTKQQDETAKQQNQAALKKENCRKAQARLSSLQNARRLRAVDEEGNVTRTTEEEHQARIAEVQEKVKKNCN